LRDNDEVFFPTGLCYIAEDPQGKARNFGEAVADPQIEHLLVLLDEAYNRTAWHGPNLRGSVRGVSAREAASPPSAGRHNIWEIVVHAAYWKYAVRRRLLGEKRGSFSLPGSNWFDRPIDRSEKAWRADMALLDKEHRLLREAVSSFQPENLDHRARGSKTSARRLIGGIAMHDVYHAGQIQLIKKLLRRGKHR
jgi:DinB family protein